MAERGQPLPRTTPRGAETWLTHSVLAFGLASLFSDAGHEAATAILPLFLVSIGGSAATLGVVEGVADALSTAAKLLAGWYSDGLQRRKPIGLLGYAATGLGMAAFAAAWTPAQVLAVRATTWLGRGMRGPVRDAMLAEAVPDAYRGRAFGFHRAMDTVGAVLGPLLALALMAHFGLRTIFVFTLVPGFLSIAAFASVREIGRHRHRSSLHASLIELPAPFRRFLFAVFVFGLGDFARSLLILRASQLLAGTGATSAPRAAIGLYVLHNAVHAASAYAIGLLGERWGARRVLAAGYALYATMALGFIAAAAHPSLGTLAFLFALAGLATSAEEVLEGTAAAELLPEHLRGTGFGTLAAVNGVGDLLASAAVGWLWTSVSPAAGFGYAAFMGIAGATALVWVRRPGVPPVRGDA